MKFRRPSFVVALAAATFALAAARDAAIAEALPGLGDHTALSWREGPPYGTHAAPTDLPDAGYSSDRRFLRLVTGHFAADFDTEKIALIGFSRRAAPIGETAAVRETLAAAPLPPAQLHLEIRVGEITYRCVGRAPLAQNARGLPTVPLDFPVRLIESGRFFQKFTLHDLEFRAAGGQRLPADTRLEVAAWPDRLALVLVARPETTWHAPHLAVRLETPDGATHVAQASEASRPPDTDYRAALLVPARPAAAMPTPDDIHVRVTPAHPRGQATVQRTSEDSAPAIRLEAPRWPSAREGTYPESMLDEFETYAVTVENRSARPQSIGLSFNHTPVKSIIGYVPMVLDADGRPSGLPVQISKNWHQAKTSAPLLYAGAWMHGRTWLNLPAHARVSFVYGTTFARWGGVPTASLAQLSLVGWGHNGFWDQLALGAFGESVCFQPGRVMRRSLLTDFRPLFQRGFAQDERWTWTGNVGGGDTMVRLDSAGRYVPFKRNVTRYASHGPNLAHVVYDEVSADDAIHSRAEIFLPRSDDCLRIYLRLRYDVTRRVAFSRLAFFQLGADFYNDTDAPVIAWGDRNGLAAEHRPKVESGARLLPAWEARGEQPWLSLHGEGRADSARVGQASRGLIVRHWRATLGGRPVPAPFFAAVGSRGPKPHLAAEIGPPPTLTGLEPGDSVEMLIEVLPVPIAADRYYGPDQRFAAALATGANTWKMVQREAAGNRPWLKPEQGAAADGWPLAIPAPAAGEVAFTLHGGLGWIPVRVVGCPGAEAGQLLRITAAGREPVVQGDAARPFWQSDYDPTTRRWSVTYNLPATELPTTYVLVPPTPGPTAPQRFTPATLAP